MQAQLMYTGTIRRRYYYLVGFIQKADSMSYPQGISVVRATALWEFIRLHILQSNDGLCHYASMPVFAVTLLSCALERVVLYERDMDCGQILCTFFSTNKHCTTFYITIHILYLPKYKMTLNLRWLLITMFNLKKKCLHSISQVFHQFVRSSYLLIKCESQLKHWSINVEKVYRYNTQLNSHWQQFQNWKRAFFMIILLQHIIFCSVRIVSWGFWWKVIPSSFNPLPTKCFRWSYSLCRC